MSSTIGHKAVTEEAVAIVLLSDEGDLNSDGNGRRHTCVIFQRIGNSCSGSWCKTNYNATTHFVWRVGFDGLHCPKHSEWLCNLSIALAGNLAFPALQGHWPKTPLALEEISLWWSLNYWMSSFSDLGFFSLPGGFSCLINATWTVPLLCLRRAAEFVKNKTCILFICIGSGYLSAWVTVYKQELSVELNKKKDIWLVSKEILHI